MAVDVAAYWDETSHQYQGLNSSSGCLFRFLAAVLELLPSCSRIAPELLPNWRQPYSLPLKVVFTAKILFFLFLLIIFQKKQKKNQIHHQLKWIKLYNKSLYDELVFTLAWYWPVKESSKYDLWFFLKFKLSLK